MRSTSSKGRPTASTAGAEGRTGSAAPFWLALAAYLVYLAGLVALAVLGKV